MSGRNTSVFSQSFARSAAIKQQQQQLQQQEQQQMIEQINSTISKEMEAYTQLYQGAVAAGTPLNDPSLQRAASVLRDDMMALSGRAYQQFGGVVPSQERIQAMLDSVPATIQTPERAAEVAGIQEGAKTTARETAKNEVNQMSPMTQAEVQAAGLPRGTVAQRGPDGSVVTVYTPPTMNLQRVSAVIHGEDRPTTLNYDPQSGIFTRQNQDGSVERIPSGMVTQVSVQGGASDVVPATRRDQLVERRDWLQFQQEQVRDMAGKLRADPTLAGVAGSARRAGQTATGVINDFSQLFDAAGITSASNMIEEARRSASAELESGGIDEATLTRLFDDPTLSEMRLFENALGFTLARLRVPEGRLLASVIDTSIKDAKITGLTSSRDVINRLDAIDKQFDNILQSLDRRIGDRQQPKVIRFEDLP
jgi:hypothetical protein